MKIPSFSPICLAFMAKGSSFVLAWGHRCTFVMSFLLSVALGVIIVCMYEVPVYPTQIGIWELEGGGDEHYYTNMYLDYDYGMGFNEKYRPNFTPTYGADIIVVKDSAQNKTSYTTHSYSWLPINYRYKDSLKDVLRREYANDELCDSLSPFFFVHEKSSIPSRYFLGKRILPGNVQFCYTTVHRSDKSYNYLPNNKEDSLRGKSVLYVYSNTDSVEKGITYTESTKYLGINKKGDGVEFSLTNYVKRSKPRLNSPYDISQAYFQYNIRFPRTSLHRSLLEIDFGGATSFSNIAPQPDSTTMSAIFYYDEEKFKEIEKNGLWLHAQFRQLENLQILRMFVITTLWGFFVALTFSSGWKVLRRMCRKFRLKHRKDKN